MYIFCRFSSFLVSIKLGLNFGNQKWQQAKLKKYIYLQLPPFISANFFPRSSKLYSYDSFSTASVIRHAVLSIHLIKYRKAMMTDCCFNQITQNGWLISRDLFLTVLGAEKSNITVPVSLALGEKLSSGLQMANFLLNPHVVRRGGSGLFPFFSSVQFSSVSQSCLTLCSPMVCSMPGLPVHHRLPEFSQTHVHWVGDAIHHLILCHPLLLSSSIFPSIRVFSNESTLRIRWPKYWSFSFNNSPSNEHSGLVGTLGWTGWISLQSKGLSRVLEWCWRSPTPQFKSINSFVLSFLYSPTLTSMNDYWKNHSLD